MKAAAAADKKKRMFYITLGNHNNVEVKPPVSSPQQRRTTALAQKPSHFATPHTFVSRISHQIQSNQQDERGSSCEFSLPKAQLPNSWSHKSSLEDTQQQHRGPPVWLALKGNESMSVLRVSTVAVWRRNTRTCLPPCPCTLFCKKTKCRRVHSKRQSEGRKTIHPKSKGCIRVSKTSIASTRTPAHQSSGTPG